MPQKSGFPHFMLKEIFEQPKALEDTIASRVSLVDAEVRIADEIRIPADHPWPHLLSARLAEIANAADVWADHLSRAIARLEAWIESDTDAGGGVEELASDLQALEVRAPTPEARQAIRSAMDALDDGLPAEAVAAALYRARQQIARN